LFYVESETHVSQCFIHYVIVLFQLGADEKWGDWRPHLSIILSNPTARPELDRKSIITLGDSLGTWILMKLFGA